MDGQGTYGQVLIPKHREVKPPNNLHGVGGLQLDLVPTDLEACGRDQLRESVRAVQTERSHGRHVLEAGQVMREPAEATHVVPVEPGNEQVAQFAVPHPVLVGKSLRVLRAVEKVALRVGEEEEARRELSPASSQHLQVAVSYGGRLRFLRNCMGIL